VLGAYRGLVSSCPEPVFARKGPYVYAGPFIGLPFHRCSAGRDVGRLRSFSALAGDIVHGLTFLKRLESFAGDVRVMDKEVLTAIIGDDKSKTLLLTEPFYRTLCHVFFSLGHTA